MDTKTGCTVLLILTLYSIPSETSFSDVLDRLRCPFYECCTDGWLRPNITGLRHVLQGSLHGQHLVIGPVLSAIKGHILNPNPSKNLVMSFHGWTGVGKNFVSKFIAEHLYHEGMKSSFVHTFISTLHFPHPALLHVYQDHLREWIRGNVSECERTLFIFDEMDKMPEGLINAIKPYLDYHQEIDGVDYRKSMFIFLSNTGGSEIVDKTFSHWSSGKKREELSAKEMEEVLTVSSYNEGGGLWHSDLISKNLISMFVPFLPLEQSHIRLCVVDQFKEKQCKYTEDDVMAVVKELQYFPIKEQLFSLSGCKKVEQKVAVHIEMYDTHCTSEQYRTEL